MLDEVTNPQTRLFLSYSRRDRSFVERLASALQGLGYLPDFDLSPVTSTSSDVGISAEDEWWKRLQEMIASTDVFVFVLSPDAIGSPVCNEEIALARALGKRVIPVLHRSIDFAKAPPRVSALNVKIDFANEAQFDVALETLVGAIERDIPWLRAASRLAASAQGWDAAGRPEDLLLHGIEIAQADELAARRPSSAPELSDLLLTFLTNSRARDAERRAIGQVERARYVELIRIMRPFLEEELRIRDSLPTPNHSGVAEEMRTERELVRSMLELNGKWHPEGALFLQSTGAVDGYAEIFRFTCCGRTVRDFLSIGDGDPPSQFRADGCQDVPSEVQHRYRERSNRFQAQLVVQYQRLVSGDGATR